MKDLVEGVYAIDDVRRDVASTLDTHKGVIDAYHRIWYGSRFTFGFTYFEGIPMLKGPNDLWIYQEIIWSLRPTLIIETGTAFGGSALYFARQLDRLGEGMVVSIDLEPNTELPSHPRISFVTGSSIDGVIVDAVRTCAQTHPRVMVVLDSDHSAAHVFEELNAYGPLVTPGQFIVVEDTNITGHPVDISWKGGPGPHEAVEAWLPLNGDFTRDALAERYLLTMHPGGWLRRAV